MAEETQTSASTPGAPSGGTKFADLKVRVVSGVLLAAVALTALFAGTVPFAIVVMVAGLAMSWEWGRIVRGGEADLPFLVHATAVILASALTMLGMAALGLAVLLVGTMLLFSMMFGNQHLLSAAGVLYTGLPMVALIWLREDMPYGIPAVLFLILVVVATDTFAFLFGRFIGGPKIWPRLSPSKTWSGLAGGVGMAALVGAGFAYVLGLDPLRLGLTAMALGVIAQAGDFGESALKRAFNIKDASQLIPGHGGVMDRMDGIVSVANAAALAALFVDAKAPAHVLLFVN